MGIRESHRRGIATRPVVDALGEPFRQRGAASLRDVEHFEHGPDAHALGVDTTAQRTILLGRGTCLKREKPTDHLGEFGLMGGRVQLHLDHPITSHFEPGPASTGVPGGTSQTIDRLVCMPPSTYDLTISCFPGRLKARRRRADASTGRRILPASNQRAVTG